GPHFIRRQKTALDAHPVRFVPGLDVAADDTVYVPFDVVASLNLRVEEELGGDLLLIPRQDGLQGIGVELLLLLLDVRVSGPRKVVQLVHLDAKHVGDLADGELRILQKLGVRHGQLQRLELKAHRQESNPVGVLQAAGHLLEALTKFPLRFLVQVANVVNDAPSLQAMLVEMMQISGRLGAALYQEPQIVDGVDAHDPIDRQPFEMQHLVRIKPAPLTAHSDDVPDLVSRANEPLIVDPDLNLASVDRPKRLDPTLVRPSSLKLDGDERITPQSPLSFDRPPEIIGRHIRVWSVFQDRVQIVVRRLTNTALGKLLVHLQRQLCYSFTEDLHTRVNRGFPQSPSTAGVDLITIN